MSDMPLSVGSKFPISEPKKITEQDINTAVEDTIREAEKQRDQFLSQTETRFSPAAK